MQAVAERAGGREDDQDPSAHRPDELELCHQLAANYIARHLAIAGRHSQIASVMPEGHSRATWQGTADRAMHRAEGVAELLDAVNPRPDGTPWIHGIQNRLR